MPKPPKENLKLHLEEPPTPSEKRPPKKWENAVMAILTSKNLKEAAQRCGVSERTLWSWRQKKEFAALYSFSRLEAIDQVHRQLLKYGRAAITTLVKNLKRKDNPLMQVSAANCILSHLRKAICGFETFPHLSDLQNVVQKLKVVMEETSFQCSPREKKDFDKLITEMERILSRADQPGDVMSFDISDEETY